MSKLFEWYRWLRLEAELAAPPAVQRWMIPRISKVKEVALLLLKPRLTIYELRGQAEGGPLTVTFAGKAYTKRRVKEFMFADVPTEKPIGKIPFWSLQCLAHAGGDVTVAELPTFLVDRLPRDSAMVMPRIVDYVVDTTGAWEEVVGRFHKNIRRHDMRILRKYGYQYEVSREKQDFEEFYHRMYLPTMEDRHGDMSLPLPYEEALQYFRHGHLFQITRDGEWVAGCVSYQHQGQLLAELSGIKDADPKLIKEGAFTAIYYVAIQWANENGYRAVNFLGTVPYMSTGIFFHKRKWGARISVPLYLQTRLWMKISRPGPGVRRFLVDHPCIVFDRDESLCGLIFVDDPDNVPAQSAEEWDKLYATPGLNRLVVQSVNDFANQSGRGNYAGSDQPVPSLL